MNRIAFVIHTKKSKFKAMVGTTHESPGDNDSIVQVLATSPAFSTEKEAADFIVANDNGIEKIYPKSFKTDGSMGIWLSEILNANPEKIKELIAASAEAIETYGEDELERFATEQRNKQ